MCLYICACVRVCMRVRVCVRRHDFAICRSKYQGFLFQTVCTCHDCNIYEHDSLQTCTGSHVHMSITNPYMSPICAHTHTYTHKLLTRHHHLAPESPADRQSSLQMCYLPLVFIRFSIFCIKKHQKFEKKSPPAVYFSVANS